jgi:ribosomal-protein-alanine N-acetyltransferase
MIIESSRLIFSLFEQKDFKLLLDLETNQDARKYFLGIASEKDVRNMLHIFIENYKLCKYSYFKVYNKENNKFIGAAGFDRHKITKEVGIGYIFYKEYWHDLYPLEAISTLLAWGRNFIATNYFISVVHKDDEVAKSCFIDCGFQFYKEENFDNMPCIYFKINNFVV